MGRRGNAPFSLPIAPCARAHHSLPAFARSFLLTPSLPIAFARRNKYEKPVEEAGAVKLLFRAVFPTVKRIQAHASCVFEKKRVQITYLCEENKSIKLQTFS